MIVIAPATAVPLGVYSDSTQAPDIAIIVENLPPEWRSCKNDEDRNVVYLGCEEMSLNRDHEHSIDERMSALGFKVERNRCRPDNFQRQITGARCFGNQCYVRYRRLK
jgi:hypothetical protein